MVARENFCIYQRLNSKNSNYTLNNHLRDYEKSQYYKKNVCKYNSIDFYRTSKASSFSSIFNYCTFNNYESIKNELLNESFNKNNSKNPKRIIPKLYKLCNMKKMQQKKTKLINKNFHKLKTYLNNNKKNSENKRKIRTKEEIEAKYNYKFSKPGSNIYKNEKSNFSLNDIMYSKIDKKESNSINKDLNNEVRDNIDNKNKFDIFKNYFSDYEEKKKSEKEKDENKLLSSADVKFRKNEEKESIIKSSDNSMQDKVIKNQLNSNYEDNSQEYVQKIKIEKDNQKNKDEEIVSNIIEDLE